jgi:hypothetical protein
MWAYALASLRTTTRSPIPWVLAGLGMAAGWFGLTMSILALGEVGSHGAGLLVGTGQAFGVLTALWAVARHLEQDAGSELVAAADASGPGRAGRLLGRWAGGTLAGLGVALLVQVGTGALESAPLIEDGPRGGIYLVIANIQAVILWGLGHMPWGSAGLLEGAPGSALRAWLPGPRDPAEAPTTLGYTAASTAGLLLLALTLARPRAARG